MPQTVLEQWVTRASQQRSEQASVSVSSQDDIVIATSPAALPATTSPNNVTAKGLLHQNVSLRHPTKDDVPKLKRLNSLLLPIPYPESFYKEIANDPEVQSLTLLAFWQHDTTTAPATTPSLIGAIRCRVLKGAVDPMLYISTLVLLSPYRGLGIATHMLNLMVRHGVEEHGTTTVGAHVWEANDAGLDWYAKRGFEESSVDANYYRKLKPHGAKIMSKSISVLDLIQDAP